MRVEINKTLALDRQHFAIDLVEGREELPAIKFPVRGDEIHISDLEMCPLKTIYQKMKRKKLMKLSALFMIRGILIERGMGRFPVSPVVVDGITLSADEFDPTHGGIEIKSTLASTKYFKPESSQLHWISRIKSYAYAWNQTYWNLLVFFLRGNYGNMMTDLKAWTYHWNPDDLRNHWQEKLNDKKNMEVWIQLARDGDDQPIDIEFIRSLKRDYITRKPDWECDGCGYSGECYYYEEVECVK